MTLRAEGAHKKLFFEKMIQLQKIKYKIPDTFFKIQGHQWIANCLKY